jgi:hypothetical protein
VKPKEIMFEHKHMDGFMSVKNNYVTLSNKLLSIGYKKTGQNTEDKTFELIEI